MKKNIRFITLKQAIVLLMNIISWLLLQILLRIRNDIQIIKPDDSVRINYKEQRLYDPFEIFVLRTQ